MGKPGVMFYFEVRPCLNRLTREEKGDLFEAILDYGQYGVLPELDGPTGVAWDFLQPKLDRDNDRYGRVSLKKAYAAYVKYANTRGEPTLSYEEWEKQQLAAVTSGSAQKTAYASICIVENADVSQTTNYKPQTSNLKQQTPNAKPQIFMEPAATPPSFSPPAREEILSYCQEQGYLMDVDSFLDYYTANGWKVGKAPMKNWQAALRRWCRKEDNDGKNATGTTWSIGTKI